MTTVRGSAPGYRSAMATTGLEVRVRQTRELVDIDRLTSSLRSLAAALRDLDVSRSPDTPHTRTVWVVRDLGYRDPYLSVQLTARPSRLADSEQAGLRPVETLVQGIEQLTRRPELPPFYSGRTIDHLLRFATPRDGIDEMSVAPVNGVVGDRHELSPDVLANARRSVKPREVSLGTVTGTLDVLNARAKSARSRIRFSISDVRVRRSVSGTASRDLIGAMRVAWGTRVAVIGYVTRNDRGQAVNVAADIIEQLPADDSGRPSTASLLGADPHWLGGQDVDSYIRDARRA